MKINYIGTAAAEGIPALFCTCPVCQHARKEKGKEVRLRSGACINESLLIDFPPDIFTAALFGYVNLPAVRNVILTHSHADHCDMHEMIYRAQPHFCNQDPGLVLHIYGNEKCKAKYDFAGTEMDGQIPCTEFHIIKAFESFVLDGVCVTPLPANHALQEEAFVFLLEQEGQRFLYGNDTGWFPEATLGYLAGKYCNGVSLDCTMCFGMPDADMGHMGFCTIVRLKQQLIRQGTADANTKFICHHFSHNGLREEGKVYTNALLTEICAREGLVPSFDGMAVTL